MGLEILNVGDGACSVVECLCTQCESVALIDCGERLAPASRPAQVLVEFLGNRLQFVSTLVVTHFDADHWKGLREIANSWAAARSTKPLLPLRVIYPRLPSAQSKLPAGTLALISTAAGSSGVRAMDLLRAWESVAEVSRMSLAAGDQFLMGCDTWEVVWPPQQLPPGLTNAVDQALQQLDDLAKRMSEEGYPGLQDNLREAYGQDFVFPSTGEEHRDVGSDMDGSLHNLSVDLDGDWTHDSHDGLSLDSDESLSRQSRGLIPVEFVEETQTIARKLARLNNLLSLVFHNRVNMYQPRTLVLGDVEGTALRYLVKPGTFLDRYDVIIAPHHGSHGLPTGFPSARVCISQAGLSHYRNWCNHLKTHTNTSCRSTFLEASPFRVL